MTKTAEDFEEYDPKPIPAYITITGGSDTSNGKIDVHYTSNEVGDLPNHTFGTYGIYFHKNTATEPQTKLFGTWVEKTKYLQEEFYGHKFEDFTHEELVEWIRINVLAAEDELHEALGEISWKPWASAQYFNREAYLGEIVDVLHFVGNLLAGAGITDEELNTAYLEKMERNRARQRAGYTGVVKCSNCKRAVDDIEAHGGRVWTELSLDGSARYVCEECTGLR